MKKLFLLLVLAGFAAGAYAQSTANANAGATVVTPIAISKTADISFGNVAVKSDAGGTVVLAPDGTTTKTGDVTLPATSGIITAASFTVTGETGYTYAITLPESATISDGASASMTLSSFTSLPSGTGTLTGGTETLKVGATLNVTAGQTNAAYTGNFDVTVNYN